MKLVLTYSQQNEYEITNHTIPFEGDENILAEEIKKDIEIFAISHEKYLKELLPDDYKHNVECCKNLCNIVDTLKWKWIPVNWKIWTLDEWFEFNKQDIASIQI